MNNPITTLYNKIPEDKQGHLRLGALLGLAFANNLILAIVVIVVVAVGKELYDAAYNHLTKTTAHEVSISDALFTVAGGALGLGTAAVIRLVVTYFIG